MRKRVTVREIAEKAGVHFTTVALALKDHPKVQAATRRRIRQIAEELGYRPDPLINALNFYRHHTRVAPFQGVLAWLSNETKEVLKEGYHFLAFFEGARDRAAALGYRIEEFPLRAPGMTPERFVKMLRNRGIQGILVGPQPLKRMGARIKIDWSPFSAVAIGHTLLWPPLDRVSNNQYRSIKLAVHELVRLGYRRIGFWMDRPSLNRVDGAWLGGYLAEMSRRGMDHPEPLIPAQFDAKLARDWLVRERVDAIISFDVHAIRLAKATGRRIPEDLGVATLHVPDDGAQSFWAGIRQNDRQIGIEAVNLLVQSIHLQERGIPEEPKRVLIEGSWVPGTSAPRVSPQK